MKYTFYSPETGERIAVTAKDYKDCFKKLHRYFDDMFETKGRELKRIVRIENVITFEFCGRDIILMEIRA